MGIVEIQYEKIYPSPTGNLLLKSDGVFLTGVYFVHCNSPVIHEEVEGLPIFQETIKWLDLYFSGVNPNFTPKYKITSGTPFQKRVWKILLQIPYGKWTTYKEIADIIAKEQGIPKMSAQAVGGAVGKNPIGIIIPCHRVLGKNGALTGYSGGIEHKQALLNLEKIDEKNLKNCYIPLE